MTVAGNQFWLTFNGEIYNYLELRDELKALGYSFHTECDAEVVIQAYDAWGTACLERFIGMFAFALWDQPRRQLFCARDRFGIKPFYYVNTKTVFAFASEMKAFAPLIPEAMHPDMDQLAWFLHYGSVYNAPHTFFQNVLELPGGHYLLITDGAVSDPVKWWDIDLERAHKTYNYDDIEGEFLRLMRDSVRLRLRSDAPVGTCLSGGLNSSTIVAFATEMLNGGQINSFSSLYSVKGLDESRYVDLVSQRYTTIRHQITPEPSDFLSRLEKITWQQDIPTPDASVFSQHFVMKLAHGNVTVLLDGQGADELFAGYLGYAIIYLADLRKRDPVRWAREYTRFIVGIYPRFFASQNLREFGASVARHFIGRHKSMSLLTPELKIAAERRQVELPERELRSDDAVNNYLYEALVRDSIPSLLHYEDRNSMAYSIEARVPFLDHRLAEFVMGVPAHHKLRGAETKVFMRHALRGILPSEIVDRKDKLGYPTPFSQWLRGPLQNEVDSYLNDVVFKRDWYNQAAVKKLWRDQVSGSKNNSQAIYRLITAEQWLRQHSG